MFPEILKLPKKLEIGEVKLNPSESALLVIDVQNDFVKPSGKLYAKGAEKIIEPIQKLLSKARSAGATVIFTQDWHIKDDPEFKIWGEHTLENTWGAQIVDELKPRESDIVVQKPSYDAFYSTRLDQILRARGVKKLVLTGLMG
ncbi:MAG: cysteine hydrolase, partial [Thaumarchaeota archaeon]|nr:cysteine hydrolase [Nitrososphaerota archaeon]